MTYSTFKLLSTVRGYHIYRRMWTPVVGKSLMAVRESGNVHDRNAIALFRGDMKIGHIPMKISRLCNSFITRGGTIEAVVTGSIQFATDLPQGGLDIPCKYFLQETRIWRERGGILLNCCGSSLIFMVASSSSVLLDMYCCQCQCRILLNGLFRGTSNGYNTEVHPPGMTTV